MPATLADPCERYRRGDLTGRRFGRLMVLERDGTTATRHVLWRVVCDCGSFKTVTGIRLKAGTQSCGCLQRETAVNLLSKHGRTDTKEHKIWRGIVQRCTNPNATNYENYGGRGIRVCERWQSFENFFSDMGTCPPGCSIDRIDNDGNYELGNCRWATRAQQNNNSRHNTIVTYRGQRMSLSDAVRLAGKVKRSIASNRIHRFGWTVDRAVETPSAKIGGRHG